MSYRLSKSSIETFVGDVFALWLTDDSGLDISQKNITFTAQGDALRLRDFKGDGRFSFNHGVLITVLKEGLSTVRVNAEEEVLTFTVNARPMRRATSEQAKNFYLGDMHTHTSMIHDHELYANRTVDLQEDYLAEIKKESLLDFGVISDHAETLNDKDFFRAFVATQKADPMRTLIFPGAESEIVYHRPNRFGIPLRKSGEILSLNCDGYILANDYESFINTFKDMPEPILIFAHPQVLGWGEPPAMWDFGFRDQSEEMKKLMCGIEVLDGDDSNLAYEYSYSVALDAGFRVSPYADGDVHEHWIKNRLPKRTVLMATEHTKEALLDAARQGRAYATESGKVKLSYSVNGQTAPADLALATEYKFHVELDTFDGDKEAMPVSMRVISDYGRTVYEADCKDQPILDFTVLSETARYFYLRFLDKNGNRTISCPVYTTRAGDDTASLAPLQPIDAKDFTAVETVSGKDASVAINGDPLDTFHADQKTASVLIDMKNEKSISAVGLVSPYVLRIKVGDHYETSEPIESIPCRIAIYTSADGVHFEKRTDACCRIFADEEIYRFAPTKARFVRFDILETVGSFSGNPDYLDAKAAIGNLTIFEE